MNPEQMGLMAQPPGQGQQAMPPQQGMPPPQQGMPPGQPGPEQGMPPGQPGPEQGMPPGQPGPEQGAPPGEEPKPSAPVPDMSEEEMQKMYEEVWFIMEDIVDDKPTFDAARKALDDAEDMMPEQLGMMTVGIIGRLEKEVGPIPQEVLELLVEDLVEEAPDRWGVKMGEKEEIRAEAAFFGMYYKAHPDRVPWNQEEVNEMLAEEFGDEEAPPEEMPPEEMPPEEMPPEEMPPEGMPPEQMMQPEQEQY